MGTWIQADFDLGEAQTIGRVNDEVTVISHQQHDPQRRQVLQPHVRY
jgi:hypothetical protein